MSKFDQTPQNLPSPITVHLRSLSQISVSANPEEAGVTVVPGPHPPKWDVMRCQFNPVGWRPEFGGERLTARVDLPKARNFEGQLVNPTLLVARLSRAGISEVAFVHRESLEVGTPLVVTLFAVEDGHAVQRGAPLHIKLGDAGAG